MIRKVRTAKVASGIAEQAFNETIAWKVLEKCGPKEPKPVFFMGYIPVFELTLEQAAKKDWQNPRRRGWRFLFVPNVGASSAVVNIKWRGYRTPKFSSASIGEKAVTHARIAREAAAWSKGKNIQHIVRLIRIPGLRRDFLCLKEFGPENYVWIKELLSSEFDQEEDTIDAVSRRAFDKLNNKPADAGRFRARG